MRNPPPGNRRWFRNLWDEIHYRDLKAHFQLHQRGNRRGAMRHVERLRQLLVVVGHDHVAISGQVARALVAEFDGNWRRGLHYRTREAELTMRLYKALDPNDEGTREYALQDRHKFEVLREFTAAKRLYARHASPAMVTTFEALIHQLQRVEEPENPGRTKGSGKAKRDMRLWSNKTFINQLRKQKAKEAGEVAKWRAGAHH
jgi:hypothetical protein